MERDGRTQINDSWNILCWIKTGNHDTNAQMEMFKSVIAVTFQNIFCAEMHQNGFFYF
jgi:hypothetical protein